MIKLSAIIVIRNEEKLLPRCLESVRKVANEIIVVHDGPCSDRSLEIARQFEAIIYNRPFVGEAEYHRPFSYDKSNGEWILQIDADEFLPEKAQKDIPRLIRSKDADAYSFSWPYFVDGQYINEGPFAKTLKPCLFRKKKMFMIGISHEYPRTYGRLVKRSDILLEHRSIKENYSSFSFQQKWVYWAKLQAQQILKIEKAPVFNVNSLSANPIYQYYVWMRKHPFLSGLLETAKFVAIYSLRGILWSGIKSWQIAFFELRYLWLVRIYVFLLKYGQSI